MANPPQFKSIPSRYIIYHRNHANGAKFVTTGIKSVVSKYVQTES